MSKTCVHWHPPGFALPAARCGVRGNAPLTSDTGRVTCRRCLRYINQSALQIEAVRGRQLELCFLDGATDRGQLLDASAAGLDIISRTGPRYLAPWREVLSLKFLEGSASKPPKELSNGVLTNTQKTKAPGSAG